MAELPRLRKIRTVAQDMREITERARELLVSRGGAMSDPHCEICQILASEFDLWEPTHGRACDRDDDPPPGVGDPVVFPVWLSRVVAGVMQDMEEEAGPPGAAADPRLG